MLGIMRDQWVLTKGVGEIVAMAERDGVLMPTKREEMVQNILSFSRDLGMASKKIPPHEQVMITTMAFFGIAAGPGALTTVGRWIGEYANVHKQRDVLAACMDTATDIVAAMERGN